MKVVFDPCESTSNQYVVIFSDLLKKKEYEIYSLKSMFTSFNLFFSIRLVHLNWFENLNGKVLPHVFLSFSKKIAQLLLIKLSGKKLVWTMHNKMPHDKNQIFLKRAMMHCMISFSDRIIIHSHVTKNILLSINKNSERKIEYVPHPDYIDCYGPLATSDNSSANPELKLLFIGAVKPYKNIELLIEIAKYFGDRIQIEISGKAGNLNYKAEIEAKSENLQGLKLNLKFIPDEALAGYIEKCDLMILPYDIRSSLNSGTVLLAFSYSRSVICPEIGTISDILSKDYVLSYTYLNPVQHFEVLKDCIIKAINLKKENPDIFKIWGSHMKEYVEKHHKKEEVVNQLAQVYNKIRC